MASYKVSKNLEKEPLLYGVKTKYFYILLIFLVLGALFLFMLLTSLLSDFSGNISVVIIYLLMFVVGFFLLHRKFSKLSSQEKYKFKKKKVFLSNKDILKQL